MASSCISSCVKEVEQPQAVVVRATFTNLYKWPESDAEFLLSISSANSRHLGHPRVVDSISCRQMYLKSYTFSRDDDQAQTTHKGIIVADSGPKRSRRVAGASRSTVKLKAAMQSVFRRLLSCTTRIDVVG